MKNKEMISYLFIGALIGAVIPFDLLATNHEFYKTLDNQAADIQGIVLGPALKITATMGAALGLGFSYMKQSPMPFIIFSALGLVAGVITPKLIDGMHSVSSMLLP